MNIPEHLVKEVKGNKTAFELLAVAVLLKMKFPNSIIGKVDNKWLRKELHCKHNVAQRILEGMRDSRFFKVNRKNGIVFIPTFKELTIKTFGKGKRKFESSSDYCKKLEIRDYTLREIKRALRELLLENMVHTKQMQQVKRLGRTQIDFRNACVTVGKEFAMTLKQLSSGFGLSASSASRYIKRMENDGKVSKTPIVAECVIPVLNDETADEWFQKNPKKTFHAWHSIYGWSGWVYYGRIYQIIERSISESFKHVIWHHKYRMSQTKNVELEYCGGTPDGDGFWAKHS